MAGESYALHRALEIIEDGGNDWGDPSNATIVAEIFGEDARRAILFLAGESGAYATTDEPGSNELREAIGRGFVALATALVAHPEVATSLAVVLENSRSFAREKTEAREAEILRLNERLYG